MLFKASAPGSLMLLGEYAVLHGKHALVCAINKRMTVVLTPRQDKKIKIISGLGKYETDIVKLTTQSPFQFVLAALKIFQKKLTSGCDIEITTEFSSTMGFASSAAVTVATLAAVTNWLDITLSNSALIKKARSIIRSVQGIGSGADVAACVMGGMIAYRAEPFFIEKLAYTHPITVVYSGSKTPTVDAIKKVQQTFLAHPKLFREICQAIGSCAVSGIDSVREQNWIELGKIMNIQQGLLDALGVNTPTLNAIIENLRQQPTILGAKISGSGLGDCAVGLTLPSPGAKRGERGGGVDNLSMTTQGVFCEKI